jgi:hypothetical protein
MEVGKSTGHRRHPGRARPLVALNVTLEAQNVGARDLLLAVFRLAVADYLGHSYSHDGDAPVRATGIQFRSEAAGFLQSAWAGYLADLIGLDSCVMWRQARLLDEHPTADGHQHAAA